MSKKVKDILNIDLALDAPQRVVSMYTAMQMMLRNVYVFCLWRKVDYIRWNSLEDYPETAKLPYHEKYGLSADKTGFRCKYGYVEYKYVPIKSLERVWWYAEHDAYRVVHYLAKHSLLRSPDINRDSIYDLLFNRALGRLLYDIKHPVVTAQASTTIIQQALYGKGVHKLGTFMLPVTKWDIPISSKSLKHLKDHFPLITCKVDTVFIYTGVTTAGKKVLCVRLRCVNKFDPTDINTVGELIYHDPYVITHPSKTTPKSRYPMLVRENGYKFEKPLDYYLGEIKNELSKLTGDECGNNISISDVLWLKAADACANRYRKERMNKNRKGDSVVLDTIVSNGEDNLEFFEF